eukprot:5892961-Prymnesium_polylepis.2
MLVYLNSKTWSCPTSQFFAAHVQRALDDGLEIAVVHELDGARVRTNPSPPAPTNQHTHVHTRIRPTLSQVAPTVDVGDATLLNY